MQYQSLIVFKFCECMEAQKCGGKRALRSVCSSTEIEIYNKITFVSDLTIAHYDSWLCIQKFMRCTNEVMLKEIVEFI